MATITVDGITIEAPDGAPLVEVLKRNGFYISNLCYIDGLKPYAGCRSCLVDVQGPPGLQLSCTTQVQDGMVVATQTDELKEARKAVLSIILANHSDRCLTCHRREHCHPGDICLRDDVVTHRCLTCSKNYRCELQATCEMVGSAGYEPWVGEERSWYQTPHPLADRANPFLEFDPQMCIICTRCQRTCDEKRHTGAITLSGKGWDTRIAFGAGGAIDESNCDFCGSCIDACPTAALMEHPNKWVAKPDRWTSTTCDSCAVGCSIKIGSQEGRGVIVRPGTGNPFSGDQLCVRGRFHYDAVKPHQRLTRHLVRRGEILAPASFADAVAEAAGALKAAATRGKVGVLVGGSATCEEAWLAGRIAREAFKTVADSSSGPVLRAVKAALETRLGTWRMAASLTSLPKAKTIVVVHDDLEESHNVASVRIKDAVVREGATLIVIGSLQSELVDFARVWLRCEGGEEGITAGRLADAIAGGEGHDESISAAADFLRGVAKDDAFVVCGPNPVSPASAAAMAGGAANLAVALVGAGASEHLIVLPADSNSWGLLDAGVAAEGDDDPLAGLAGLLVVRDDPTMRLPGAAEALSQIESVVVIDDLLHETAGRALAIIAGSRAYSSDGTYTTGDFRAMKLAPAVAAGGDAVAVITGLRALGAALGLDLPETAEAAMVELAQANAAYEAVSNLIVGEGVKLKVAAGVIAKQVPVDAIAPAGAGLRLIVARDLYTAADAAAIRHPDADQLHRGDRIQLSEEDAKRLSINDGDEIEISDGTHTLRARAAVAERVREGSVFVSSLLQGGAVVEFLGGDVAPAVRVGAAVAV